MASAELTAGRLQLPVAGLGGRLGRAGQARPIAGFAVLICVTLALSLRLPAGTAVVSLAAFGILHNVLELRYMVFVAAVMAVVIAVVSRRR